MPHSAFERGVPIGWTLIIAENVNAKDTPRPQAECGTRISSLPIMYCQALFTGVALGIGYLGNHNCIME